MPYPSRDRDPQILAPTEDELKFADLKPEQTGAYQANQDRWVAAEEYAKSLGAKQNISKPLAPKTTGLPANPAAQGVALQRSAFQKRKLDEANARIASWNNRLAIPVKRYPTLAKAMMQDPTLTEADVRRIVNFSAAWTAADAINSAVTAQSQVNIFLSLPEAQRAVVQDILDSQNQAIQDSIERRKRDERLASQEEATYGPARQLAAGFGGGVSDLATGFMRGVDAIMENTQHVFAAAEYGNIKAQREGGISSVLDPFFYWEDTAEGTYDNAVIQQARKEYGDIPVDLILEIKQASLEGDENPIMTVSEKYVNDPARAEYISLLTKRVIDDPEMEKQQQRILALADKLDTASTSDLGAMLTTNNPVTGEPVDVNNMWRGSMLQQGLSKGINVATSVALDPTIAASKALRLFRGARFGLEKIASTAGAESVEKALSMRTVNSYITRMTADIANYNAAREAGVATSKIGKQLADDYKNFFPEDVLMDLAKAKVHTADEFIAYVNETNRMAQIARAEVAGMESVGIIGKAEASRKIADIEAGTVFGRMYGQQGSRRSTPLLPQNNLLAADNIRRIIPNHVSKIGDKKTRQEEISKLFKDANDPNKSFGSMFNEQAERLGKEARLGGQGLSPSKNIAALWDKTTRLFSTTPGTERIYTKDARDTGIFYKYARMHLPAHQARLLADEWRNGTQAERVLMWIGIVRTSTYARGFEDIKDIVLKLPNDRRMSVGEYAKTLSVGTRDDVRFSPDSISVIDNGEEIPLNDYLTPAVEGGNPELFNVATVGGSILRTSPSDFNGIEHPLHLWQTSDYLAVPNLNELQRITKRNLLINTIRGFDPVGGQSIATSIVNYWSLLNLMGPRYAARNAMEDWTLYSLTGGYFMDAVKGFGVAKGIREARGAKLGIFAKNRRKITDKVSGDSDPYSFWNFIVRPNLDPEDVAKAQLAAAEGNLDVLRQLSVKAILRLETGKLLSKEEQRFASYFAGSSAAYSKLDEISESAVHLGNGTVPGTDIAAGSSAGILSDQGIIIYPRGSYTDVAVSGGKNMARFSYWHRNIRNTLKGDGIIGTTAVENLDNPELAIRLIAQQIANDTKFGYKQRLAAFYDMRTAVSDDEFARRYVQDVLNLFSRKDGSFNKEFWSKFVMINDDGTRVARFATQSNGKWEAPVSVSDLMKMKSDDMPAYVLGRETQDEAIKLDMSISDKIWTAMGNTVNRISREPIFFANYLRERKRLLGYENRLKNELGADIAEETAHRHALDRATSVLLSYTDNPANQTILAWRVRNWARYYRATEDFYRRVYRMAKFEPIGFYKAALTLNALEDQGFIYNDEFGDKYFIYPGDGLVNNLVGQVTSIFGGNNMFVSSTPLIFGGKVKMLAPSFDPNSARPTLSSPVAAFAFKGLTSVFPQFNALEKYILGEYTEGKSAIEAALPASIIRATAAIMSKANPDDRESMYASAYMSAVKVLYAAGKMPDLSAGESAQDEALSAVGTVASNILAARLVGSFFYQASPQVMTNDVTSFARKYNIPSMSADYKARVNKFREAGETDPYGMALQDGISVFGPSYVVYNVSRKERGEELKKLPDLVHVDEVVRFAEDNSKVIKDYPAVSHFLAPTTGDFSIESVSAAAQYFEDAGLNRPVEATKYARRVKYAQGMYEYFQSSREYREALTQATTQEEINQIEEAWKLTKAVLKTSKYPGLGAYMQETDYGAWEEEAINRNNTGSVRRMVDDYYAGKYGPIPKSIEYIGEALSTYDYYMTARAEITGSSEPERLAKSAYKIDLLKSLQSIAADDPNAEMFIRQVLYVILEADSEGNPK